MPYKDAEKRRQAAARRQKTYRKRHPDRTGPRHLKWRLWQRNARLKADFGISLEQYNALLAAQDFGCAICGRPRGKRRLHVDHDEEGRIRGLLCSPCNPGLGHFRHDPVRLRIAAACLEQHFLLPNVSMFKRDPALLRSAAGYLEARG